MMKRETFGEMFRFAVVGTISTVGCPPLQLFPAHRAAEFLPVAGSEQGDGPSWCICHRRAHELHRRQVCL